MCQFADNPNPKTSNRHDSTTTTLIQTRTEQIDTP